MTPPPPLWICGLLESIDQPVKAGISEEGGEKGRGLLCVVEKRPAERKQEKKGPWLFAWLY